MKVLHEILTFLSLSHCSYEGTRLVEQFQRYVGGEVFVETD